ncbi:hypothetical protein [Evansella clarkii]|uniref:hypothetical protein n=1 Tax=Evansella clarkii TaxID=79879 RepID=UPI0011174ED8|nr:hypothetical protein [Evansella clarkii]
MKTFMLIFTTGDSLAPQAKAQHLLNLHSVRFHSVLFASGITSKSVTSPLMCRFVSRILFEDTLTEEETVSPPLAAINTV